MLTFALLFVAGTLALHQLPALPGPAWLLVPLAGVGLALGHRRGRRLAVGLFAGFGWAHLYALATVPAGLPDDDGVMRRVVEGQVVSLVARKGQLARFVLVADTVTGDDDRLQGRWPLRLSWYRAPDVQPGERWRLPVRLRAAHGYAAPGAWDYEGWLYWQGISYTGYVSRDGPAQRLATATCCRLARLRAALVQRLRAAELGGFAGGVIGAVTVGDRSGLDEDARALFRETGTSHLMAISGLHVSLVAGFALMLVAFAWRRLPALCNRAPARLAGLAAALLLAAVYALLAGFTLPTQRALVMMAALAIGLLWRREGSLVHGLALAAVAVLAWHPPSVVTAGFWLSFGAVATIAAVLHLSRGAPAWRRALAVHLGLGLSLWPVLAWFGLPSALLAPVANLVAIPVFSFLVVPLSLLGMLLLGLDPDIGRPLLIAVAFVLDWLATALRWLADLRGPDLAARSLPGSLLAVVVTGLLLLFAPRGTPLRWLGLPLVLAGWLPRAPALDHGDFRLHLLDVGQGLSVVVETRHHALVYDTGPRYPSGFATATAVVAPFLRESGITRIDRLVASHGDVDHAGGVAQLMQAVPVGDLVTGEVARIEQPARACFAGERWHWDGVEFSFISPEPGSQPEGNDASCVLRVRNAAGGALLTGDIEAAAEQALVERAGEALRSRIVIAPHHGSGSSSDERLIAATRPDYVLFAAGAANRYGFPDEAVVTRWQSAGARTLTTIDSGTIGFRFDADGQLHGPAQHRPRHRRFWHRGAGSAGGPLAVSSRD